MSRFKLGILLFAFYSAAVSAAHASVQQNYATPQSNLSSVSVSHESAQIVGNTNIFAIGIDDATYTIISSVTDLQGSVYTVAVPLFRGSGLSQAIYYASNIKAGANTVKVVLNDATPYVDVRITQYSGLASSSGFVAGSSVEGTGNLATTPNIGAYANNLLFAVGMTLSGFTGAGSGYTKRVITNPKLDIGENRVASSHGSYNAAAPINNASHILQVAAVGASPNPNSCSGSGPCAHSGWDSVLCSRGNFDSSNFAQRCNFKYTMHPVQP